MDKVLKYKFVAVKNLIRFSNLPLGVTENILAGKENFAIKHTLAINPKEMKFTF